MRRWVADASVLINLLGSGYFPEIVKANGFRLVACDQAFREVRRHPRDNGASPLAVLLGSGVLERVSLSGSALDCFRQLAGAPSPDDLGDGEAATIAYASSAGYGVLLDDGKARRICAASYGQLSVMSSVDLLREPFLSQQLGEDVIRRALFDALRFSRMRVLPDHEEWVCSVLGPLAAQCPSLPARLVSEPRTRGG